MEWRIGFLAETPLTGIAGTQRIVEKQRAGLPVHGLAGLT
jgi:hypothetical protein